MVYLNNINILSISTADASFINKPITRAETLEAISAVKVNKVLGPGEYTVEFY